MRASGMGREKRVEEEELKINEGEKKKKEVEGYDCENAKRGDGGYKRQGVGKEKSQGKP